MHSPLNWLRIDMQFIRKLHRSLLNLYPKRFRKEYVEELQTVFNLSLEDAARQNSLKLTKVILLELISLPGAIVHEHLRERRKRMTGKFSSRFDFAPGSRTEALAALAPFLVGMVMIVFGYIGNYINFPLWSQVVFVILFWSLVLGLFLLGPAKGLPRWFLPYLGLPLPIVSLTLFNSIMEKWGVYLMYNAPGFFSTFSQVGLLWMGLILLLLLLVVISRSVPRFRPFHQRLRDDWTLLSFIIYGAMPFVLFITYNEYKNEEPFMFMSLMVLAVCGWLYLKSYEPLKRFLYLYGGVALSMLVAAIGKSVLEESSFPGGSSTWQTEFMDTLIIWLWLALIMLIPVSFKLFSRLDDHPKKV